MVVVLGNGGGGLGLKLSFLHLSTWRMYTLVALPAKTEIIFNSVRIVQLTNPSIKEDDGFAQLYWRPRAQGLQYSHPAGLQLCTAMAAQNIGPCGTCPSICV